MANTAEVLAANSQLQSQYAELSSLFERKLWHELTLKLEEVVKLEAAPQLLQIADSFLPQFESKINQLRYAQIISSILRQCVDAGVLTAQQGIERLEKTAEKKLGEGSLLLQVEAASLRLTQGELKKVKQTLDDAKPQAVPVCLKYYQCESEYYKLAGPPEEFYRAALSLLSYASIEDLDDSLATDIALAALAGNVYNFGEVLATPILATLEGTRNAWLGELLNIFARGDVDAFHSLLSKHRSEFEQTVLVSRFDFIKEKITLLSLMNLIFETPSHKRTLSFATIAERTRLELDQVEWLAMRAMALGLVKGLIDQVEATIQVSWLAPRVLDHQQINHLVAQLDALDDKSTTAFNLIHDQTLDLL